jgi:hypothetical protein
MVGSWATTLLKWPLGAVEAGLSAVPDEEPSVKGGKPSGLGRPLLGPSDDHKAPVWQQTITGSILCPLHLLKR